MIIPAFDGSNGSDKEFLAYFSDVLAENVTIANFEKVLGNGSEGTHWLCASNVEDALQLLDAGVGKVIFDLDTFLRIENEINDVSPQRIGVVIGHSQSLNKLQQATYQPSVYILAGDLQAAANDSVVVEFAKSVKKNLLSEGGARRVCILTDAAPQLETISHLDKVGLDVIIPMQFLTTSIPAEAGKVNVGQALMASAVTDRADGLYPTMVVDEHKVALGLVYSSVESVAESLKTGTGVYQSRSRGLWYKGATSGATQTLMNVQFDCDSDALQFTVRQNGSGFCHLNTKSCFGAESGISALEKTLFQRKENAPEGSYTARLFNDSKLLRAKLMEEAEELCDAQTKEDVAWEAADLIYFAITKCVAAGVSVSDIEKNLDKKALKISRRPGNAKPKWEAAQNNKAEEPKAAPQPAPQPTVPADGRIKMMTYEANKISAKERSDLLKRPIINSTDIMGRVTPIINAVRERGDAAVLELTAKFDRVQMPATVIKAPFSPESMQLDEKTKAAIDQAYENIYRFHEAQMDRETLVVETMPGVVCSRFARPIEKVGLYVPGGTAVLPSSALMLGIPAKVAGCKQIVLATPPRPDGSIVPDVMYVAHKVGATHIVAAGGAQAVAAMAYGTETIPKVDKICGPGNQYVTAAKMLAQNDSSCLVSIDMPAGPSEVLVVADQNSNPAYVASDLLSQAEHGADSQVVLVAAGITDEKLAEIEEQIHVQASRLPRVDIVRQSIPKSYTLRVSNVAEAMDFSNDYAPEHLILHIDDAQDVIPLVQNAGSVFVGAYSPESCGDYASGTNHTLPTYGYSRMYSGVNTLTFVKHITSQQLTADGLNRLGDTVMQLAEREGLEAHRNAVAIRVADLRK
ncbi:trifunctional histidinol dehydrogenase [Umbelopsis nana]